VTAPRIDAHHHVWDLAAHPQVWMDTPGPGDAPDSPGAWADPLRRDFGPEDLKPLIDTHGISASFVVQTVSDLGETRDLLDMAARTAWIAGVVGWFDLTDPGIADTIAALRAGPGGDRLVGVRHQVHDEPDPEWLLRPDVMRGLHAVADAGLVYDLLVRAEHLKPVRQVVRAIPHCRFVVDHIAKPAIAARAREPWLTDMAVLASEPNVTCKLSGMVTEADWRAWTVDDLFPYARHVLAMFGPYRTMFGSDWPVCTLAATYGQVVGAATELFARAAFELDSPESDAFFGGTARIVYLE
jgi:L-fuconolactonase